MSIEVALGLVTLFLMDRQQLHSQEFQAPPELLAEAKKDPAKFRTRTIAVLREAGYHGSASSVWKGDWPSGIWGTLCTWAETSQDGYERDAKANAVARDYLGTLAEAHGIKFVWSDEDEDYVAIGSVSS